MYVCIFEDVPLVKLYLHACQVRVTVGDSGLVVLNCVTRDFPALINSLVC